MLKPLRRYFLYSLPTICMAALLATVAMIGPARIAHADIVNPHPLPPANSVTHAMLQSGIVTDTNVAGTAAVQLSKLGTPSDQGDILFGGYLGTATSSIFSYSTSTTQLTVNGIKLTNGQICNGANCATLPAADGSANQLLKTNGAGTWGWTSVSNSVLSKDYLAGEALKAGDAVAIGNGISIATTTGTNSTSFDMTTQTWQAFPITVPATHNFLNTITFSVIGGDGTVRGYTFDVTFDPDSAGAPNGSSIIGTVSQTVNAAGSAVTSTYTPAAPVAVTGGGTYWVVIHTTNSPGGLIPAIAGSTVGIQHRSFSSNGASWSGGSNYPFISYTTSTSVAGSAYEASASSASSFRYTDYIGFAKQAYAAGATSTIEYAGIATATSSLSAGQTYFLGNTNGAIGTSAGSTSYKVGRGMGDGTLLIVQATQ